MAPLLPTKKDRLKRLIEAGHFPLELPPVFLTRVYAEKIEALQKAWPAHDLTKWTSSPEQFSIPKAGHARRTLAVVNPISQFRVSKLIADDWVAIRKYIRSSGMTEFVPIIDMGGDRAIIPSNYTEINRRRAILRARFTRVLRTDITRFYPSIYTHSLPWALHGKEWTKANLNTPVLRAKLGDKLDRAVRDGQGRQTIGIPTGPETSRVLAEIIAVGIDRRLYPQKSRAKKHGLRYVDDYSVGVEEGTSDDAAVARVSAAFQYFDLEINATKTRVDTSGVDERPAWSRILREFRFDKNQPEKSLRDYFDAAILLHAEETDDAIITYAVKRSRSFILYFGSVNYYINRLLHLGRICTDAIPSIVQAILDRNSRYTGVDSDNVRDFILSTIRVRSPLSQSFEVAWALFLARGLRLKLKRKDLGPVFKLESSICALVTMDLDSKGLIDGNADQAVWKKFATQDGLRGPMWMVAYEAVQKGWWSGGVSDLYVKSHPLFGPMLNEGVYFYDPGKNVSTTFAELKRLMIDRARVSRILRNLDSYF